MQNGGNGALSPSLQLGTDAGATVTAAPPEGTTVRIGVVESSKPEEGTDAVVAIVKGAFRMEENVRQFADCVARCGGLEGRVTAPFGKLGKCKVRFPPGSVCEAGASVSIFVPGNA